MRMALARQDIILPKTMVYVSQINRQKQRHLHLRQHQQNRFCKGYCSVTNQMRDTLDLIKNFYLPIFQAKTIPTEDLLKDLRKSAEENMGVHNAIEFLTKSTLDTMTHHFDQDLTSKESQELQERAFIHFGQGTLFDDTPSPDTVTKTRRPESYMVHMMDGSTLFYYLWHLIISQYMHNNSSPDDTILLQSNRNIGLAAEIDFKQEPKQSVDPTGVNPKNPKIDDNILSSLREKYIDSDLINIADDMRLLVGSYWQRVKQRDKP